MGTANTTTTSRPGLYKRLFARMIASESKTEREYYNSRKRTLLGNLHGDVLEIGPGSGVNLAFYASDVRWQGLEPNPAMYPYLLNEAKRLGIPVQLREGHADRLDVADNSIDAVVGTLVLCSVPDQQHVLQEIRRVLKPGGRFVFIEHVAARRETGLRRRQQFVRPLWSLLADGCHPDRETWAAIDNAGFSDVQLEHFRIPMPIVGPHIAGYAVK